MEKKNFLQNKSFLLVMGLNQTLLYVALKACVNPKNNVEDY